MVTMRWKSGHILFSYSKLLFGDITSVYPNIKFVETDLLELQSLVRLNAVQIHKVFCTYLRSLSTKDLTNHSANQHDNVMPKRRSFDLFAMVVVCCRVWVSTNV